MTIPLKSIVIDSSSWPCLPPKPQAPKILYSEARSEGYVQSAALRNFGAAPLPPIPVDVQSPARSTSIAKYRFLKLGLVACALLLAGLAFAEPKLGNAVNPTTHIIFQGPEMQTLTSFSGNLSNDSFAGLAGNSLANPVWEATPTVNADANVQMKQLLPNLSSYSVKPNVSDGESSIAGLPTSELSPDSTAIGAVAIATVALGVSLASIPRRRRSSAPISNKEVTQGGASDDWSDDDNPDLDALATPPIAGLAYVEPEVLLASMQRAYPELRIAQASGSFALSSVTGNNAENQDYALAFDFTSAALGPVQVCIISDGCGGHMGGRQASYTAISSCVEELLASTETDLGKTASRCLDAASERVALVGTRMWGPNDFRATLIVLLANKNEYALAHLGDGGADVRRADGTWERLLTPQRQEGTGYLTGSLGPTRYGEPVLQTLKRMPGDFLVAGTDGIYADEITDLDNFWTWPRQAFEAGQGLGSVLTKFVDKCLHSMPEVFDDNVTALVLTTPVPISAPVITKALTTAAALNMAMAIYQSVDAMRG